MFNILLEDHGGKVILMRFGPTDLGDAAGGIQQVFPAAEPPAVLVAHGVPVSPHVVDQEKVSCSMAGSIRSAANLSVFSQTVPTTSHFSRWAACSLPATEIW